MIRVQKMNLPYLLSIFLVLPVPPVQREKLRGRRNAYKVRHLDKERKDVLTDPFKQGPLLLSTPMPNLLMLV